MAFAVSWRKQLTDVAYLVPYTSYSWLRECKCGKLVSSPWHPKAWYTPFRRSWGFVAWFSRIYRWISQNKYSALSGGPPRGRSTPRPLISAPGWYIHTSYYTNTYYLVRMFSSHRRNRYIRIIRFCIDISWWISEQPYIWQHAHLWSSYWSDQVRSRSRVHPWSANEIPQTKTPYHTRRAPIKNESPSSREDITRSRCEPYHLPRTAVGGAVLDSVSRAQVFVPHKAGPQVTKCETTKDHIAQNESLPTSFWSLPEFGKLFYILKPCSKRVDERWECSPLLRDKRRHVSGSRWDIVDKTSFIYDHDLQLVRRPLRAKHLHILADWSWNVQRW